MASSMGIKGVSKMRKSDLIAAIGGQAPQARVARQQHPEPRAPEEARAEEPRPEVTLPASESPTGDRPFGDRQSGQARTDAPAGTPARRGARLRSRPPVRS